MKNDSVRSFLQKKYVTILMASLGFIVLVNLITARAAVVSSVDLLARGIENVVHSNRNEFLDELALNDIPALKQHLEILRARLGVDYIQLEHNEVRYSSGENPLFGRPRISILQVVFPVAPVVVSISNDFGGFKAIIKVHFGELIRRTTLFPMLYQMAVTTAGIVAIIGGIFFLSFVQIKRRLLDPLSDLSVHLSRTGADYQGDLQKDGLAEIQELHHAVKRYEALRKREGVAQVATQVVHDIRSPLMALEMVVSGLSGVPEESRNLLRGAVRRIQSIADNLLATHRGDPSPRLKPLSSVLIFPLLRSLVEEKTVQYQARKGVRIDLEFGEKLWNVCVQSQRTELIRVLSNIVDNAIESIAEAGSVTVTVRRELSNILISVRDTGRGISSVRLPSIFEKGVSYREGGNGLGLSHALECVTQWGGKLNVQSLEGVGTTVDISLPAAATPKWLPSCITLADDALLVVVDDEPSIHAAWALKFRDLKQQSLFCSSPEGFQAKVSETLASSPVFLIDYEFNGSEQNGLDLIHAYGLQGKSILVTGQAEKEGVVRRCEELGIPLLPKTLIPYVPINQLGS